MPFPPEAPFNPKVSAVPNLDSSSGNPAAYKDPKSTASMGLKLQAMSDQASADTLYDPPPPPRKGEKEGFQVQNLYKRGPWITQTEACKKQDTYFFNEEGFNDFKGYHESSTLSSTNWILLSITAAAAGLLICSFVQKK
uniref:Uncharacterized protein n=1 Tax=viral metagenome TaxID=1070528 RepID=A0A6C0LMJ7_9ZZZZ